MLDDITLFIHIMQQGGLSGAARHLSLPAATVTRRLQKLEQQLGCQLLHRSARQCVPTQEGEVYYQTYADLVQQFEQAKQQLSEEMKQLRGKLRVLAPANLSHGLLRTMWLGFTRSYPEIQLELSLSNQLQDMIKNKADIAIRVGPQPDSLLYQQKLGQVDTIMVSSPLYLAKTGEPQHPSELKEHRIIGTTVLSKWKLKHTGSGTSLEVFPRFSTQINDTSFVKYLACDAQGIALLPVIEVKSELKSGKLIQILPQWRGEVRNIYVVWPSGQLLNAKAKCLRDYIQGYIKAHLV